MGGKDQQKPLRRGGPGIDAGALAAEVLCLVALAQLLSLKWIVFASWLLPIVGLIVPILLWPFLWGASFVTAAVSLGFCIGSCRKAKRKKVLLAAAGFDLALLVFLVLFTVFYFIPTSSLEGTVWQGMDQFFRKVDAWFFQAPFGRTIDPP